MGAVKIAINHNFITLSEDVINEIIGLYSQPFHFSLLDLFDHDIKAETDYIRLNQYACIRTSTDTKCFAMFTDSSVNRFVIGPSIDTLSEFIDLALKCGIHLKWKQ